MRYGSFVIESLPSHEDRIVRSGSSLTEQVIDAVREAIRDGDLITGQLYSVYQLADWLKVSRSPVRDALLRLSEAGVVRFERNRGFRVVLPDPREIAEIFAIRIALEVPAVRKVAERDDQQLREELHAGIDTMARAAEERDLRAFALADRALHDRILRAAGNSRSRRIVSELRETTELLGASTIDRSRTLDDLLAEHIPLVAAIVAQDADTAVRTIRWHLEHTCRLLVQQAALDQGSRISIDELWTDLVN